MPLDAKLRVSGAASVGSGLSLQLFGYRVLLILLASCGWEVMSVLRPRSTLGAASQERRPPRGRSLAFDGRRGHFCARGGMTQCRPYFKTGQPRPALFVTRSGSYHLVHGSHLPARNPPRVSGAVAFGDQIETAAFAGPCWPARSAACWSPALSSAWTDRVSGGLNASGELEMGRVRLDVQTLLARSAAHVTSRVAEHPRVHMILRASRPTFGQIRVLPGC